MARAKVKYFWVRMQHMPDERRVAAHFTEQEDEDDCWRVIGSPYPYYGYENPQVAEIGPEIPRYKP